MPRPKMPETIRVGAHTYKVIRRPSREMGDENAYVKVDKLEIAVVKGLRFTVAQEKLLHEVNHAAVSPALFYTSPKTPAEYEEAFVDTLTPPLLQVLQDNPDLVEFLRYKDKK